LRDPGGKREDEGDPFLRARVKRNCEAQKKISTGETDATFGGLIREKDGGNEGYQMTLRVATLICQNDVSQGAGAKGEIHSKKNGAHAERH